MEQILNFITIQFPSIIATLTNITALIMVLSKVSKGIQELRESIIKSNSEIKKENAELKRELAQAKRENRQLKNIVYHVKDTKNED